MAPPAMALDDVTFGHERGSPVIRQFSATLQPGRLCCLIGPNAAGKSTLIKLMLGEWQPWQGRIELDGQPVGRLSAARRAAMLSHVPQRGGTSFAFTVRQAVAMGRFMLPRQHQAVAEALEACQLTPLADDIYSQLSVGQQQRVLLARAIAQSRGQGRVMLLDEPGSAMDLRHLHAMMLLLKAQAAAGLAVLMVVHDLNLAAAHADDVWLMDRGRLVARGPWQEVMEPGRLSGVYGIGLTMQSPAAADHASRPVFTIGPT